LGFTSVQVIQQPRTSLLAIILLKLDYFSIFSGKEALDLLTQSSGVMEDLMKVLDLPQDV